MHCIRSIQIEAEKSSGVTSDRLYKVDEANLIDKLGEAAFITLVGMNFVFYICAVIVILSKRIFIRCFLREGVQK